MPYFTSLANYIATVTARFNKPRRSLANDGLLKQDIIEALTDTAKYSEDVKVYAEGLNSGFVARSLSLHSVIYVDGVNGNDTRTGTTNDHNAVTGRVKTLARVAQLHNDKSRSLKVFIVGNLDIASEITFMIDMLYIVIEQNIVVTVKKKTIYDPTPTAIGEGPWKTNFNCSVVNIFVYLGASLVLESHAGSNGLGMQAYYTSLQCAFQMTPDRMGTRVDAYQMFYISVANAATLNIGNNQTFVGPGSSGYYALAWNNRAVYKRETGGSGTVVLGTNATESICVGDRTFLRSYHPVSNTDAKVMEGETVVSPTNNNLYTKRGGTIYKYAAAAY